MRSHTWIMWRHCALLVNNSLNILFINMLRSISSLSIRLGLPLPYWRIYWPSLDMSKPPQMIFYLFSAMGATPTRSHIFSFQILSLYDTSIPKILISAIPILCSCCPFTAQHSQPYNTAGWGSAWMRGKWARKENVKGKGGKGEHFPLLGRRENGKWKKIGKENSVSPLPHFPLTFPSESGKILRQIFSPTICPCHSRVSSQTILLLLLHNTARASLFSMISYLSCAHSISLFSIIFIVRDCGLIVEHWRTMGVCLCSIFCLLYLCVCLRVQQCKREGRCLSHKPSTHSSHSSAAFTSDYMFVFFK